MATLIFPTSVARNCFTASKIRSHITPNRFDTPGSATASCAPLPQATPAGTTAEGVTHADELVACHHALARDLGGDLGGRSDRGSLPREAYRASGHSHSQRRYLPWAAHRGSLGDAGSIAARRAQSRCAARRRTRGEGAHRRARVHARGR